MFGDDPLGADVKSPPRPESLSRPIRRPRGRDDFIGWVYAGVRRAGEKSGIWECGDQRTSIRSLIMENFAGPIPLTRIMSSGAENAPTSSLNAMILRDRETPIPGSSSSSRWEASLRFTLVREGSVLSPWLQISGDSSRGSQLAEVDIVSRGVKASSSRSSGTCRGFRSFTHEIAAPTSVRPLTKKAASRSFRVK